MADPFLAEIRVWACNFAPRNWAFCDGQFVSIASNTALFSLIGATFGGNGYTTFGLPDFRGRVAVGVGQAPTLNAVQWGETGGTEAVTLAAAEIPNHTHNLNVFRRLGLLLAPTAASVPASSDGGNSYVAPPNPVGPSDLALMDTKIVSTTAFGGATGQAHENRMPHLVLNFCIALAGMFPPRQ